MPGRTHSCVALTERVSELATCPSQDGSCSALTGVRASDSPGPMVSLIPETWAGEVWPFLTAATAKFPCHSEVFDQAHFDQAHDGRHVVGGTALFLMTNQ